MCKLMLLVADYWKDNFYKILNVNDCDHNFTADVSRKLRNFRHNSNMAVSAKKYYRNCVKIRTRKICSDYLATCDNKFEFKASHGTDMCIYTFKEFIEYYKCRGTTVYVTFLDASKAFDRLTLYDPGGGALKAPPLRFFALTHLILELHYCALVTFPKK